MDPLQRKWNPLEILDRSESGKATYHDRKWVLMDVGGKLKEKWEIERKRKQKLVWDSNHTSFILRPCFR